VLILYQRSVKNSYYEKIASSTVRIDEIPFEIPNSWTWIRLGAIIQVVSGVSYDKQDVRTRGIRIIRGGNIENLKIKLLHDDVYLPQNYLDEEKLIKKGDVVIVASTGSKIAIGRAGFANENYENTQIGAFLRIVRPIDLCLSHYIQLLFSSDYYRDHIRNLVHGNTINNIKNEYITDLLVPIPPVEEQKSIAQCCKELFLSLQMIEKSLS